MVRLRGLPPIRSKAEALLDAANRYVELAFPTNPLTRVSKAALNASIKALHEAQEAFISALRKHEGFTL